MTEPLKPALRVSLADPGELPTIVPYLLGFQPGRSIVALCLDARNQHQLLARLDLLLVDDEGCDHTDSAVADLVSRVARTDTERVVLVSYEAQAGESRPVATAMRHALTAASVEVAADVVVHAGSVCVVDSDGVAGPVSPMPDPADVPLVADLVLAGHAVLADRDAQFTAVRPRADGDCPAGLVARIGEYRRLYWAARTAGLLHLAGVAADEVDELDDDRIAQTLAHAVGPTPDASEVRAAFAATEVAAESGRPWPWDLLQNACLASWGAVLRGEVAEPADELLPALLGPLTDHMLRDAIMAWLTPGSLSLAAFDPALRESLRDLLGEQVRRREPTRRRDVAGKARREHRRSARRAARAAADEGVDDLSIKARLDERQSRIEGVCRLAPTSWAPDVLAVAAAHAWWCDDLSKAALCAEEALSIDGSHRLSQLVQHAVSHGLRADGSLAWTPRSTSAA